jgi:hypothetical protein
MMLRFGLAAFFLCLLLQGCASGAKRIAVTGVEDALEGEIKVSTFGYSRPFMGVVNPSDYFFRGYISKTTGLKRYDLYVITNSRDWMWWDTAKYLRGGAPAQSVAHRLGHDAQCSQYGCAHYEDVSISLDETLLREWAQAESDVVVRLKSRRHSSKMDIKISPLEASDFLIQMDRL